VYRGIRSVLPKQLTTEPLNLRPAMQDAAAPSELTRSRPITQSSASAGTSDFSFDAEVVSRETASSESAPAGAAPLFRPAIFQVHDKYLISQIQSGIAIIDQHAAHERILYEKAARSFAERMFNSQQLLFPMLLEFEPEEDAVFQEVMADLGELGFQIRPFGPRSYSVEAVPAGLKRASEVSMIHSMLEEYSEFRRARFEPRDALAAGFACHAAIRTGDSLTTEEMMALVDELFATKFPLTCPHGRPTVIHLKLSELDRRFKRTE